MNESGPGASRVDRLDGRRALIVHSHMAALASRTQPNISAFGVFRFSNLSGVLFYTEILRLLRTYVVYVLYVYSLFWHSGNLSALAHVDTVPDFRLPRGATQSWPGSRATSVMESSTEQPSAVFVANLPPECSPDALL